MSRSKMPVPSAPASEGDLGTPMPVAVALFALAIPLGTVLALVALRFWFPPVHDSLVGSKPKAYWYLSRASAFVAFALLWVSMALGLSISGRVARVWPGGPVAFDLHQYTSLLGLLFTVFHAAILIGDRYSNFTVMQLAVPFAGSTYRPVWVGLGQVAIYLMLLVWFSATVKHRIVRRWWRRLHFLSFAVFALALGHGVLSGTDSGTLWARAIYWIAAASILVLTIYRILVSRDTPAPVPRAARTVRPPASVGPQGMVMRGDSTRSKE